MEQQLINLKELTRYGLQLCTELDCEPDQLERHLKSKVQSLPLDVRPQISGVIMAMKRTRWGVPVI